MGISVRTRNIIKIIVIVIVVLILFILVMSELDRNRSRKVAVSRSMYYERGNWITAPFNVLTSISVRDKRDLEPFLDMERNFPRHNKLRDNWQRIRDEVLKSYSNGDMTKINGDLFFTKIADDKWTKLYLKWYGPILNDAREKIPFTCDLIESMPEIKSAMISVLEPGAIISKHSGPWNGVVRYHLALVVPDDRENCWIKLDGEKFSWTEGEDVLFDDTFVHQVHNNTNQKRIVLFCDVKRNFGNALSDTINDVACRVAKVTTRNNK